MSTGRAGGVALKNVVRNSQKMVRRCALILTRVGCDCAVDARWLCGGCAVKATWWRRCGGAVAVRWPRGGARWRRGGGADCAYAVTVPMTATFLPHGHVSAVRGTTKEAEIGGGGGSGRSSVVLEEEGRRQCSYVRSGLSRPVWACFGCILGLLFGGNKRRLRR